MYMFDLAKTDSLEKCAIKYFQIKKGKLFSRLFLFKIYATPQTQPSYNQNVNCLNWH